MKSKVYIRADGNQTIGLGHLVRCSALAYMLKADFEITFICREIPDTFLTELEDCGFSCAKIENEDEFFDQIKDNIFVVLDGYNFDTAYQKRIKAKGAKLVCIDDLHDKEFYADLIINHAPGVRSNDYMAQPYTQFALGPKYALLRPVFLEQAKKERTIEKIETILICFGGSDYKNFTEIVLKLVANIDNLKKIIVVTGSEYSFLDSLNRIVNKDKRIMHYNSVDEKKMLSLMLDSDLAIVPASGILFEVLASGCYVISGYYVDNQKAIYEGFRTLTNIGDAGDFQLLGIQLKDVFYKYTIHKQKKVIDGLSGDRIVQKFKSLQN